MIAWPWLFVAVFVGAALGFFAAGLCRCAAKGDNL